MAISSILLHSNTKIGFLIVQNELSMAAISSKQLPVIGNQLTIVNSIFHFLKPIFFDINVDGFSCVIGKVKKSVY